MATEDVQAYVVDRRSLAPVAPLNNYVSLSYNQQLRRHGTAQLRVRSSDINESMVQQLVDGNFGLIVNRVWRDQRGRQRRERWIGFAVKWSYKVGESFIFESDETQIANHAILLGKEQTMGDVSSRFVWNEYAENVEQEWPVPQTDIVGRAPTQFPNPTDEARFGNSIRESRSKYGVREKLFDVRNLSEYPGELIADIFKKYARPKQTAKYFSQSHAGFAEAEYTITLWDLLGYLSFPIVNSTGLTVVAASQLRGSSHVSPHSAAWALLHRDFTHSGVDTSAILPNASSDLTFIGRSRKSSTPLHVPNNISDMYLNTPPEYDPSRSFSTSDLKWSPVGKSIEELALLGDFGVSYVEDDEGRYSMRFKFLKGIQEDSDEISDSWLDRDLDLELGDEVSASLRMQTGSLTNNIKIETNNDFDGMLALSKHVDIKIGSTPKIRYELIDDEFNFQEALKNLESRISNQEAS